MLIFDSQAKVAELNKSNISNGSKQEETITMSYMFCGGKSLRKNDTTETFNENTASAKRQGA